MYTYFYDQKLSQPKYRKTLSRLELKMADWGIGGEAIRLNQFQNTRSLIKEVLKGQTRNLIAVGNDETAIKISTALIQEKINFPNQDIAFGFLALNEPFELAKVLGLPTGLKACEAISARIIKNLDVFSVNRKHYFFTYLDIAYPEHKTGKRIAKLPWFKTKSFPVTLKIGQKFQASLSAIKLQIFNINPFPKNQLRINPQDGLINVAVLGNLARLKLAKFKKLILRSDWQNLPNLSFFTAKNLMASSNRPLPIFLGNTKIPRLPATFEPCGQKLQVIVGKNRRF